MDKLSVIVSDQFKGPENSSYDPTACQSCSVDRDDIWSEGGEQGREVGDRMVRLGRSARILANNQDGLKDGGVRR